MNSLLGRRRKIGELFLYLFWIIWKEENRRAFDISKSGSSNQTIFYVWLRSTWRLLIVHDGFH